MSGYGSDDDWDGEVDADEYIEVMVTHLVRDEGSIVIFEGVVQSEGADDGALVRFGADHRPAQLIADALCYEGDDEYHAPIVVIQDWQILWMKVESA